MTKIFIENLTNFIGRDIKETFYLEKIIKVSNNKPYYKVYLRDKSGKIEGRIWSEYIDDKYSDYESSIVLVMGQIQIYNGNIQIAIKKLEPIPNNKISIFDYCPCIKNINQLKQDLFDLIEKVQDKHLKIMLNLVWGNENFMNGIISRPGGSVEDMIGGVLKRTVDVATTCIDITKHSNLSNNFNLDVLISSALLEDIGIVKEYESFPTFSRTITGKLVGHPIVSSNMIYLLLHTVEELGDIRKKLSAKLQHCIITHHGPLNDIIKPMTQEAIILCRVNNLIGTVNLSTKTIDNDSNTQDFTLYDKRLETCLYKK